MLRHFGLFPLLPPRHSDMLGSLDAAEASNGLEIALAVA